MSTTLSKHFAFSHELTSGDFQEVSISPKGQLTLGQGHKLVLAMASISRHEDSGQAETAATSEVEDHLHEYTLVLTGGKSAIKFTQFTQDGVKKTSNGPIVSGANITEINWDFSVIHCHAQASVVILVFD